MNLICDQVTAVSHLERETAGSVGMDVQHSPPLTIEHNLENPMKTLVEKRNAAGDRYAAAVVELRAAFTDLAALDRLLSTPSFGPPPEIVPFRHPTFAPNVSGSFVDDIPAAIAAHAQ